MKQEKISDALELLPEEMLEQAQSERVKKKRKRRWPKWVAIAACFCLVAVGVWDTLDRFEYNFYARCSSYPGEFANGRYYYTVDHSGVWSYSPGGGNRKELSTYWYGEWSVNDYGIYYWQGLGLYVRPHETGERQKLYSASVFDCTHIRFELQQDGNVILTVYNKNTEIVYELLLDGITGEVLETVMEPTSYRVGDHYYSDKHMAIGNREFLFTKLGVEAFRYTMTENGEPVLPEDASIVLYSEKYFDGALWLQLWTEKDYEKDELDYVILRADGSTEFVTLPNENYEGGVSRYLFHVEFDDYDGVVCCTDIDTGKRWPLKANAPHEVHDITTDGQYLYTMVPWAHAQACWQLEFDDDGRPVGMRLITTDIFGADH